MDCTKLHESVTMEMEISTSLGTKVTACDPLSTLDEIFQQCLVDGEDLTSEGMSAFGEKVKELYSEFLIGTDAHSSQIPYLNQAYFTSGEMQPNTIVRYRGQIQDIMNPEFFIAAYKKIDEETCCKKWVQSRYNDCISCGEGDFIYDFDAPDVFTIERTPVVLAPIPGESEWVRDAAWDETVRGGIPTEDLMQTLCHANGKTVIENLKKRSSSDINEPGDNAHARKVAGKSSDVKDFEDESFLRNEADSFYGRFQGNPNGVCCLAKMCGSRGDDIRLNDMIEVIALYTLDPVSLPTPLEDGITDFDDSLNAKLPPPSLMPRLQVLCYRHLDPSFPLINRACTSGTTKFAENLRVIYAKKQLSPASGSSDYLLSSLKDYLFPHDSLQLLRSKLVSTLSAILSGQVTFSNNMRTLINYPRRKDADIAAEYLLLALLSRVENRNDTSMLVGRFVLNIVGMTSSEDRASTLVRFLENILPRCVKVDSNIDILNQSAYMPFKDSETNLLTSSPLLLAAGTLMIVDESEMSEGTLAESGLKSFHALRYFFVLVQSSFVITSYSTSISFSFHPDPSYMNKFCRLSSIITLCASL